MHGQLLQNLKDKAKSLATKENLDKASAAAMKSMDKARAEFDSADFDYAILISDNSGLFDVKEKGEAVAKVSSVMNLFSSFSKNDELSDEEKARFNRESGELWYGSGKYSLAEKKIRAGKNTL
jgi:hypothetical protein